MRGTSLPSRSSIGWKHIRAVLIFVLERITSWRAIPHVVRIPIALFAPWNGQLRRSSRYTGFYGAEGDLRVDACDSYEWTDT